MLGGSFFSVSQAGGLIATLSLLTPHAWFLRGLGDLAGGGGAGAVLGPAAAILAFAAVTGAIALVAHGEADRAVKALAIAGTDLRRLFRFRLNVFFLFVLPMLIILLLGAAFGGSDRARIGVVGGTGGPLARDAVGARSTLSRRCGSSGSRASGACDAPSRAAASRPGS